MSRILIAGAGMGGLTAAIALQRNGHDVSVFERAPELAEVGAGLTLWPNATKVLRKLAIEVEDIAAPLRASELRSWSGKLLVSADVSTMANRAGAPILGIHRADLQARLAGTLGCRSISLNRTCLGYSQDPNSVTLQFADSSHQSGDALIGADGISSAIRAARFGIEPVRYSGYTAWRGITQSEQEPAARGVTLMAMGRGSQFGCLPIGGGRTYWFATANLEAGGRDTNRDSLLARLTGWYPPVREVIRSTPESAILRNDIIDRPPVRDWGDGRMTLLGDAAHPTTPNLGQGACQAIEDALVLARCLTAPTGIAAALRDYERQRYSRTAALTNQSFFLGRMLTLENPLASWFRDRAFALLSGLTLKQTEKLVAFEP